MNLISHEERLDIAISFDGYFNLKEMRDSDIKRILGYVIDRFLRERYKKDVLVDLSHSFSYSLDLHRNTLKVKLLICRSCNSIHLLKNVLFLFTDRFRSAQKIKYGDAFMLNHKIMNSFIALMSVINSRRACLI